MKEAHLRELVQEKLAEAERLLELVDYKNLTSADDILLYYSADTFYEDLSLEQVLQNIFLVVHELVEISEIKKMNLQLTKDVILKNPSKIYKAHLIAAEKEFKIAFLLGNIEHLKRRRNDVENWLSDPYLPSDLVKKAKQLLKTVDEYIEKSKKK